MHDQNKPKLLELLRAHPEWKVLDVGGGEQPLLRADVTVDIMPFKECGDQGCIGDLGDFENKRLCGDSWIEMDICVDRWPFDTAEFDFVFCSNVLEDVRDPVRVVQEINRVGRQGYFEFPRVGQELTQGVDENHQIGHGYWHHRWFIGWDGQTLQFLPKLPIIQDPAIYHVPIKSFSPGYGSMPRFNTTNKQGFAPAYWNEHVHGEEVLAGSPDEYLTFLKEMLNV